MPRLSALVFAAAALALAGSAGAQVYKWKDANGTMHYSDSAPTNGVEYQRVKISSGASTPVTPAPASTNAAGTTTSSSAAAAAQTAPASTAKIPDTAANRAKLCQDLDHNIGLLSSNQPLTSGDASTPQQNMSDVQRRQELATARAQKSQYCTGG